MARRHIYESELKLFGNHVNLLYKIGVLPDPWNNDRKRMDTVNGSLFQYWFPFQIAMFVFDGIFKVIRTVENSGNKELDWLTKVNLWRYTVENFILNGFSIYMLWDPSSLRDIMNNVTSAVERFHGSENGCRASVKSRGFKIIMGSVTFVTIFLPLMRVIKAVSAPEHPSLYTSLLPDTVQKNMALRMILGLFQWYVMATHYGLGFYFFAFQLMVTLMATTMLQSCREVISRVKRNPWKVEEIRQHITELSLVLNMLSSAFTYLILMANIVVATVAIVFNATMAVVNLQLHRLVIGSLLFGQILYLTKQMGSIYEFGLELGQEVKSQIALPKEMRKSWYAWRVPRRSVGNCFYVDREVPLSILSVILTNTANFIIEVRLVAR